MVTKPFLLHKYVETAEAVQRGAIKLVPTLKNLPHQERLRKSEFKRDKMEAYKVKNGVYDVNVSEGLPMEQVGSMTKGHEMTMISKDPRLDIRRYTFCSRMVNN